MTQYWFHTNPVWLRASRRVAGDNAVVTSLVVYKSSKLVARFGFPDSVSP